MGHRPGWSALHAYVSDDVHDTWHDTATRKGFAVSVLLEVLAGELGWLLDEETDDGKRIVEACRQLQGERRRRH